VKVFVTGATGFIGTYVADLISETGHAIRCLVRKTSDTSRLKKLGAEFVVGDVTDKDSLVKGMTDCDWVVNPANHYSF